MKERIGRFRNADGDEFPGSKTHSGECTAGAQMKAADFRRKLTKRFSMLGEVYTQEGFLPSLECFVRRLGRGTLGNNKHGYPRFNYALLRLTDICYDLVHRVDTGGMIALPEMEGRGHIYAGTPPRAWKLIMKHLPIDPRHFSYVDLGCGKGRTLLLATEMGFGRTIGVDLSAQLLDIARQNLARQCATGELICCDVVDFEFPKQPLVLFMYSPFYPDVMQRIAERVRESIGDFPRDVYVVYYSAQSREIWSNLGFTVFREANYVFPNYAIYFMNSPGPVLESSSESA